MISEIIEYDRSDECKKKIVELIDKANSFYSDRKFEFDCWKQKGNNYSEYSITTHWDNYDNEGPDTWYLSNANNTYVYFDLWKGQFVTMHKESIQAKEIFKIKKHFSI